MKKTLLPFIFILVLRFVNAQTPVAYYPFNGNANDAVGSLNGTVNGATLTPDRFGNANSAYSFDGVDDFIGLNGPFNGYTELTVSAWYKVTSTSSDLQAILSSDNSGKFIHMQLNTEGTTDNAVYVDGSAAILLNRPAPVLNEWRLVVITAKNGDTRFYENGVLISSDNTTFSNISSADLLRIGSGYLNSRFFHGAIDEVKIYNTALTAAQVQNEYSANAYGSQFGNSAQMSGSSDYIDCGNNAAFIITTNLTIEAWVKPTTHGLVRQIVHKGGSGANIDLTGYQLRSDGGTSITLIISNANTLDGVGTSISASDLNKWMHVAGVYDGSSLKFYKNGVLVASHTSTQTITHVATPLLIGKRSDGFNYDGSLDEIRIWNTARSQAEIVANMNAQLVGNESGLVAYYDMNRNGQGAGLTVDNKATATGAALNGTTVGTATTPVFGPGFRQQKPGSGNGITFSTASNQQITAPNIPINDISFTIQLWQKRNSMGSTDLCISQGIPSQNQALALGYFNNSFIFSFYANDLFASVTDDLNWHQWSCVYDKSIASPAANRFIYRDGILVGSNRTNSDFIGNTGTFNIGSWVNTSNKGMDGSLDEVRVWNIALSQSQIRDGMCRKIIDTDALYSNLVAYYNFDESTGNTAFDGTANANNGTLINSPTRPPSGAAIGNSSAHDYVNATKTASIAHATGEMFTVTSTSGNPDGMQVYRIDEQPNTLNGAVGVGTNNKYFGVFQAGGNAPTYEATYNYTGNPGINGENESTLALYKRNNNSETDWINGGAILNTTNNTLTLSGESTEYLLGSTGKVLPLTLTSFSGFKQNNDAVLQWQTANEVNVNRFELERSDDAQIFVTVGTVLPGINSYTFNDVNIFNSKAVAFYRLKPIDVDGRFSSSEIIRLSNQLLTQLAVFPNPVKDIVTISSLKPNGTISLFTLGGKLLIKQIIIGQSLTLDMSSYAKGFYLLQFQFKDEVISQKILKQ